jgi:negative regulator of replication initiation
VLDDAEYQQLRRAARRKGTTVSEWVRQALRLSARQEPTGTVERKLAVVRAAVKHAFPTADIDDMLREIERGYGQGLPG